jgi:hypothetical protein
VTVLEPIAAGVTVEVPDVRREVVLDPRARALTEEVPRVWEVTSTDTRPPE